MQTGNRLLRRFLAIPTVEHPLVTDPLPIREIPAPPTLAFFLGRPDDALTTPGAIPASSSVAVEDAVSPGHELGSAGDRGMRLSPVAGKVVGVRSTPDTRAGKPGLAVLVEPSGNGAPLPPAFPALDPVAASDTKLRQRIAEAAILTGALNPRPLAGALATLAEKDGGTVVVVAIDREPGVSATLATYEERREDSIRAAALLAQAANAARAVIAVPADRAAAATDIAKSLAGNARVEVLAIPPIYPESLQPLVARRAGDPHALVVPLDSALGAYGAVATGSLPTTKVLTVVAADGQPLGNFRVAFGATLQHLFDALEIECADHDKIVAGGPMRGFAQYSLDSTIDPTIDAISIVPERAHPRWSDEPCVSCGDCIDVCPVDLQVQQLGRFAEFSLFDRMEAHGLAYCIECGLCATVCPAHRPLLQLLRLAKREALTG